MSIKCRQGKKKEHSRKEQEGQNPFSVECCNNFTIKETCYSYPVFALLPWTLFPILGLNISNVVTTTKEHLTVLLMSCFATALKFTLKK